jgi:hypothetical protein
MITQSVPTRRCARGGPVGWSGGSGLLAARAPRSRSWVTAFSRQSCSNSTSAGLGLVKRR